MGSRQFSQKQKMVNLDSAVEIGVKQAAELAGAHYTSVYDWRSQLKSLGKQVFLDYKPSYPGRGVKQITSEQEKAVLDGKLGRSCRTCIVVHETPVTNRMQVLHDVPTYLIEPADNYGRFYKLFSRLELEPVVQSLAGMMVSSQGRRQLSRFLIKGVYGQYQGNYNAHNLTGLGSALWFVDQFWN